MTIAGTLPIWRFATQVSLLAAALLLSCFVSARDWSYTVRPGDTLNTVCERYIRGPQWSVCALELGKYNNLDAQAGVAAGSVILIPYEWLRRPPQPATVVFARGDVRYYAGDRADSGSSMPADRLLHMGDRLVTGDGNARIRFADGSELLVRPNSDIRFDRLSLYDGYSFVDTMLILKQGSTVNSVQREADGKSRFRISTPAGVAAVRGTEFRVSASAESGDAVMHSEVLEGEVAVSAGSETRALDEGYGVRTEARREVPPAVELLPGPAWLEPVESRVSMPYVVRWSGQTAATSYLLDIYDGKGLLKSVESGSPSLVLNDLPLGEYTLSLSAIDANGLRGLESRRSVAVFPQVSRPQLARDRLNVDDSGRRARLDWPVVEEAASYRIELSADGSFGRGVKVIETPDASVDLASWTPKSIRVVAISADGRESEPSNVIDWQPDIDYSPFIFALYSILLAVVIF